LLDLGRALQERWLPEISSALPSFALVLSVETMVALAALVLLSRLNPRQFQEDAGRSLNKVLALELG
jgi:BCD family chlorophyll transporter-like MFS transporter